jgi:hypothetical protein
VKVTVNRGREGLAVEAAAGEGVLGCVRVHYLGYGRVVPFRMLGEAGTQH